MSKVRRSASKVARTRAPRAARLVTDLLADPQNRRRRTPRNLGLITDGLKAVGAARSIVIDETNQILAGNGVAEAAAAAGITKLRIVDADGSTIIAVRRLDLTPEQKRVLAIYDNRAGELAEWNLEQLAADLKSGADLGAFFTPKELAALLDIVAPPAEFVAVDESLAVEHTCIECGYEWSGKG